MEEGEARGFERIKTQMCWWINLNENETTGLKLTWSNGRTEIT